MPFGTDVRVSTHLLIHVSMVIGKGRGAPALTCFSKTKKGSGN